MAPDIKPLISVLCLTKDRPEWLPRSVELFLEQDYSRKEIIILDQSAPAKRTILPADPRIRHFFFDREARVHDRNSRGILEAQGEILCYWDDDDYFHPERLSLQAQPIAEGKASMTGIPLAAGLTVTLPGPRWWQIQRVIRGPQKLSNPVHGPRPDKPRIPFSDATALFRRPRIHGKNDPILGLAKIPFLQEVLVQDNRPLPILIPHLYVYVRHGRNSFKHDESWKYENRPAPEWIPAAQLAFWNTVPWRSECDV